MSEQKFLNAQTESKVTIGDFTFSPVMVTPDLVSTAILAGADPNHNGSVLSCVSTSAAMPDGNNIVSITIIVEGNE